MITFGFSFLKAKATVDRLFFARFKESIGEMLIDLNKGTKFSVVMSEFFSFQQPRRDLIPKKYNNVKNECMINFHLVNNISSYQEVGNSV